MRVAALALAVASSSLVAQRPIAVRGVAFDSLHSVPLGDAFITMSGGGTTRSAMADGQGRFHFDSLAPGAYTVAMQHAAIDSLGLPGISARVNVSDVSSEVRISIPGFATLWRAACGPSAPPSDSGFVYGVVRDASTQRVVAGASIDLSWVEMAMDKDKHLSQRRWRNQTRTDGNGSYSVCGVPAGIAVRIQALTDSAASGVIDLAPSDTRLQRRDLIAGKLTGQRGTIAGMLTGAVGSPFRDARIIVEGLPETRSGADGRFIVRDVPAGTRQVEIMAIGMMPISVTADVLPNDTALVSAEIRKVATLDPVKVTGLARVRDFYRELDDRKKTGFGHMMDSTHLNSLGTIAAAFGSLPSTYVRRGRVGFVVQFPSGGGFCTATVWIDGKRSDFEELASLHPLDVALIEVYPRRMLVPLKFATPNQSCGSLIVWRKYAIAP